MKYKLLIIACYVIFESFIAYAIWQTVVIQKASNITKTWEIGYFVIMGILMIIWLRPSKKKGK